MALTTCLVAFTASAGTLGVYWLLAQEVDAVEVAKLIVLPGPVRLIRSLSSLLSPWSCVAILSGGLATSAAGQQLLLEVGKLCIVLAGLIIWLVRCSLQQAFVYSHSERRQQCWDALRSGSRILQQLVAQLSMAAGVHGGGPPGALALPLAAPPPVGPGLAGSFVVVPGADGWDEHLVVGDLPGSMSAVALTTADEPPHSFVYRELPLMPGLFRRIVGVNAGRGPPPVPPLAERDINWISTGVAAWAPTPAQMAALLAEGQAMVQQVLACRHLHGPDVMLPGLPLASVPGVPGRGGGPAGATPPAAAGLPAGVPHPMAAAPAAPPPAAAAPAPGPLVPAPGQGLAAAGP